MCHFQLQFSQEICPVVGLLFYCSCIRSFVRNFHSFFHSGCISLHSHQQCKRVPFFPYSLQYLLLFTFWWWPLWLVWGNISIVVLICISLIMSHVELLFMYLLALCMSPLEKCLFRSFAHVFVWGVRFSPIGFMSCLNPLSVVPFAVIFSCPGCCWFLDYGFLCLAVFN